MSETAWNGYAAEMFDAARDDLTPRRARHTDWGHYGNADDAPSKAEAREEEGS
jgi:hypothetical protein